MILLICKTHGDEKHGRQADCDQSDQNNFSEHTRSLCIAKFFMRAKESDENGGIFIGGIRKKMVSECLLF